MIGSTIVLARRSYSKPPIAEALVEFRFEGVVEDPTLPGRLSVELIDVYAGKAQVQQILNAQVSNPANVALTEERRVLLCSLDGQRLVSIGTGVFSVNTLSRYDGWGPFQQRIERALKVYWEHASPRGVNRVAVRYLNTISIPADHPATNYFNGIPAELGALRMHRTSVAAKSEYLCDGGVKLNVTFATIKGHSDKPQYLLDLELVWEVAPGTLLSRDESIDKANELHTREGEAFEAIITDLTRELFNAK